MASVCVIGGGMAGATAALAARQAGARVTLVARAPGATALAGGTLDVAATRQAWDRAHTTLDAARVLAADPYHPYHRVGLSRLEEAIAFLKPKRFGFDGPGLREAPLVLATEAGTYKPAPFALTSIAAGSLTHGGTIGLVRLGGYHRFPAAFAARSLPWLGERQGRQLEVKVLDVALPERPGPDPSPAEVARILDSEPALERLGAALRAAAREAHVSRALFPAVLGLSESRAARLSEIAGLPCAELVASTPSVPGVRLQRALEAALDFAEVERRQQSVRRVHLRGREVRAVELEDGTEIEAAAFVLATGKFLAGGLRRRSRLEETLFDLPVFYRGAEVGETDLLKLTAAKPWEPQKLFACGVRTDALLRPLGSEGKLLYENLFAAGSVLAGYDAEWEGSGLGVAIATGYAAGLGATGRL